MPMRLQVPAVKRDVLHVAAQEVTVQNSSPTRKQIDEANEDSYNSHMKDEDIDEVGAASTLQSRRRRSERRRKKKEN